MAGHDLGKSGNGDGDAGYAQGKPEADSDRKGLAIFVTNGNEDVADIEVDINVLNSICEKLKASPFETHTSFRDAHQRSYNHYLSLDRVSESQTSTDEYPFTWREVLDEAFVPVLCKRLKDSLTDGKVDVNAALTNAEKGTVDSWKQRSTCDWRTKVNVRYKDVVNDDKRDEKWTKKFEEKLEDELGERRSRIFDADIIDKSSMMAVKGGQKFSFTNMETNADEDSEELKNLERMNVPEGCRFHVIRLHESKKSYGLLLVLNQPEDAGLYQDQRAQEEEEGEEQDNVVDVGDSSRMIVFRLELCDESGSQIGRYASIDDVKMSPSENSGRLRLESADSASLTDFIEQIKTKFDINETSKLEKIFEEERLIWENDKWEEKEPEFRDPGDKPIKLQVHATVSKEKNRPEEVLSTDTSSKLVFPQQKAVAERLLQRVKKVLEKSDKALKTFCGLNFCVLVPVMNTLRDQTAARINEWVLCDGIQHFEPSSDLGDHSVGGNPSSSHKVPWEAVMTHHDSYKDQVDRFKKAAKKNEDQLFVIVVDECHHSYTSSGYYSKFVNDDELMKLSNVLVVMVSATPYANLTANSRIPGCELNGENEPDDAQSEEHHVVKWFPPASNEFSGGNKDFQIRVSSNAIAPLSQRSSYFRLEDFLRTIPSFLRSYQVSRPKPKAEKDFHRPRIAQLIRRADEPFREIMLDKWMPKINPTKGRLAWHLWLVDMIFSMTYYSVCRWDHEGFKLKAMNDCKVDEDMAAKFQDDFKDAVEGVFSPELGVFSPELDSSKDSSKGPITWLQNVKMKQVNGSRNILPRDFVKESADFLKEAREILLESHIGDRPIAKFLQSKIDAEGKLRENADFERYFTESDLIILNFLKPQKEWERIKGSRIERKDQAWKVMGPLSIVRVYCQRDGELHHCVQMPIFCNVGREKQND